MNKITGTLIEGSLESLSLQLAYPVSIIVSAILASFLLNYLHKKRFLLLWILAGVVSSSASVLLINSSLGIKLLIAAFMGSSLGIGMPTLLTYFTEITPTENRGKIGGATFFATVMSAIFFIMFFQGLDLTLNAVALTGWRGWSLAIIHLVPEQMKPSEDFSKSKRMYTGFLNRTFLLYFATWLMFTLVSGFGANIVAFYGGDYRNRFKLIEPAVAAFSGLIGGIFCDWIGRKRVITFGFVSLGLAYAILGLASEVWFSWLFFYVIDGVALGILWMTFVVVLWGEISHHNIPKSYAVGEAPYFLTGIVSSILAPFTALISRTSAFSLAALFLFVAVIPLMYVPETLPEKKIRERELKIYIDKAKKVKEKYA
ncbi:hypothetical protein HXY32_08085 [Candidatus Bathyarchaeota archaeon]|nr:hypothetical protein [Candidatus Bathyarchaeota archaeon]